MPYSEEDYDDFVRDLVSDPANPPKIAVLGGFLGKSSAKDCVRLYLDSTLQRYVEIPEEAILFRQKLDRAVSPLGGSRIWVRADAEIIPPQVQQPQKMTAQFLSGNILQNFGQGAAKGNTTNLGAITNINPSWVDGCPTDMFGVLCPPPTEQGTTIICRTDFGPICEFSMVAANTCDATGMCVQETGLTEIPTVLRGRSIGVECESQMSGDCLPPEILGRLRANVRRNFWRQNRR